MAESAHSQAKKFLEEHTKLLIVPHANVDPDGLSSALACYHVFTALGKECTVICPDTLPESLEFLPGFDKLEQELKDTQDVIITLDLKHGVEVEKLRYAIEENKVNIIVTPKKGELTGRDVSFKEGAFPYDGIVVVDCAELKLLGSLYTDHERFFRRVPILNIDHHLSNTKFGNVILLNTTAASATEVLYEWFILEPEWKTKITPDVATLLMTGLITDTRSFQDPNTTPRSLEVAAELLDLGARQQEIIKFIYKTKPLSTLKIWGRALNHIQVNTKEGIVWSAISREDLQEMEATSKETHSIIDELLTTIPDAGVYVLFTEIEEGGLKASVRSNETIDASALCGKLFGGGGHARASGFRLKDYDNFQLTVVDTVQKIIQEMKVQRGEIVEGGGSGGREVKELKEPKDKKGRKNDETIDIMQKLSE